MDRVCHPFTGDHKILQQTKDYAIFFFSVWEAHYFLISKLFCGEVNFPDNQEKAHHIYEQGYWGNERYTHSSMLKVVQWSPSRSDVNVRLFFTFKQEQVKKNQIKIAQKVRFLEFLANFAW